MLPVRFGLLGMVEKRQGHFPETEDGTTSLLKGMTETQHGNCVAALFNETCYSIVNESARLMIATIKTHPKAYDN